MLRSQLFFNTIFLLTCKTYLILEIGVFLFWKITWSKAFLLYGYSWFRINLFTCSFTECFKFHNHNMSNNCLISIYTYMCSVWAYNLDKWSNMTCQPPEKNFNNGIRTSTTESFRGFIRYKNSNRRAYILQNRPLQYSHVGNRFKNPRILSF